MSAGRVRVRLHRAHPEGNLSSGDTSAVCGNHEVATLHFVHLQIKGSWSQRRLPDFAMSVQAFQTNE